MRAVEENGRVSYVGSFDSEPQRALRFKVTATSAATRR